MCKEKYGETLFLFLPLYKYYLDGSLQIIWKFKSKDKTLKTKSNLKSHYLKWYKSFLYFVFIFCSLKTTTI